MRHHIACCGHDAAATIGANVPYRRMGGAARQVEEVAAFRGAGESSAQ